MKKKFVFIIVFLSLTLFLMQGAVSASDPLATSIEFKIPSGGTKRPQVPYVMFNVGGAEIGQANVALIYYETTDGSYDYYDVAGSYAHYELIEGKYSRPAIPSDDVADGTVFDEVKIVIVSTGVYYSDNFDPKSYIDALPAEYFVEGVNKLSIDLTIDITEDTQPKLLKRMGWYGEFMISGLPSNAFITIKRIGDVIAGKNGVTDAVGAWDFEDTPIYGINWLLGLGDLFAIPTLPMHEIWSYVAQEGTTSTDVPTYIFSYTKYPASYDLHYEATQQILVWKNAVSDGGTVFKTFDDSNFIQAAVNRTTSSAVRYSVPANNGVATVNSVTGEVSIVGMGSVVVTATTAAVGSYGSASIYYTLEVGLRSAPDAPAGLTAIKVTANEGDNGGINGFDMNSLYEYRLHGSQGWIDVAANSGSLTGLSVGSYDVRIRQTSTTQPSDIATVVVEWAPFHNIAWSNPDLMSEAKTVGLGVTDTFVETATCSTNGAKPIIYSSDNSSVATVDANGRVTIVGEGVAVISATVAAVGNDYRETTISYVLRVVVGDINGDNTVNAEDLAMILDADVFNTSQHEPGYNAQMDVNKDGEINFSDLAIARNSANFEH